MSGNTYHIEKTNTSAEFPHYTIQKTSPEKETITATIEEVWSAKSQSNKPLDALEFAKNMLEDFTTNKSSQEHIG